MQDDVWLSALAFGLYLVPNKRPAFWLFSMIFPLTFSLFVVILFVLKSSSTPCFLISFESPYWLNKNILSTVNQRQQLKFNLIMPPCQELCSNNLQQTTFSCRSMSAGTVYCILYTVCTVYCTITCVRQECS